jgi:hypothetical protein
MKNNQVYLDTHKHTKVKVGLMVSLMESLILCDATPT